MIRFVGMCAAFVMMMGCGVGQDPSGSNNQGRLCGATLVTSGSFVADTSSTPPTDSGGCWPVGMWTFTASVDSNDCSTPPQPLTQYQIRGDQTVDQNGDPNYEMTYVTDPSARNIVKVSQGGSGLCEGELDIYSADGKTVWLLKPELNADNSITGDGEYGEYDSDQFPYGG